MVGQAAAVVESAVVRRLPTNEPKQKGDDGGLAKAIDENDDDNITKEIGNRTIQKAIRDRLDHIVKKEVQDKLKHEHRLPSKEELDDLVEKELKEIWYDLIWGARRHKRRKQKVEAIKMSVAIFDWCLLSIALLVFIGFFWLMVDWPGSGLWHGAALLVWALVGVCYNAMIYKRLGRTPAMVWLVGYVLELTFSIENLFVLHYIVKAFRMPKRVLQKVLFLVVLTQMIFQGLFYMDLATWLRSIRVLPYLLGLWLLYLGIQAAMDQDREDFDIMQTPLVNAVRYVLGKRMLMTQSGHGINLFVKTDRWCMTPAGLLLVVLVVADLLLEIDVTLTKIESLPNHYISFSSSVVAAFAVPELFFIAIDLLSRYPGLKYGISFVLLFVGAQALLHDLFTITAVASLCVIVCAMLSAVVISAALDLGKSSPKESTP
eukprot:CAMPEP_0172803706 /NCGR_PEP_ID=MMETSP1075-20121228/4683_1 /TAXON_ID=2916 /ORGANISM="Ceratium fusus, Strain PA161109" /LENGTH=430 /DNA_ID=CAMNT_0013642173 /DNA_START=235 /DNA_END=1528 /DNA_ORIENTATION=-